MAFLTSPAFSTAHYISNILFRTNENGLCPACRQSYPEDPVNFQPLSSAELHKIKTEKKQKVLQQKNKIIEGRKHLSEYRVLQKNLVYAVGISQRMANPELLKKFVLKFLIFLILKLKKIFF